MQSKPIKVFKENYYGWIKLFIFWTVLDLCCSILSQWQSHLFWNYLYNSSYISKKENSRQINNLWYLFRCVTGMSYQHCRIIAKEFVPILKLVKHVCCKVKGSSWPLHLQGDGFIKWNAPGVWKTQHASRKQVWICNPPPP